MGPVVIDVSSHEKSCDKSKNIGIFENLERLQTKGYIIKDRIDILRPSVGPGGLGANIGFGTRGLFSSRPGLGNLSTPPDKEEPLDKRIIGFSGIKGERRSENNCVDFGMEYSVDNEQCLMSSKSVQDETRKIIRGIEPLVTPSLSTAGLNDTSGRGDASLIERDQQMPLPAKMESPIKAYNGKKRVVINNNQNLEQRAKRMRQRIRTLQTRQLVIHTKEQLVTSVTQLIDDTQKKNEIQKKDETNTLKEQEVNDSTIKSNCHLEVQIKDKGISPLSGLNILPVSPPVSTGLLKDGRYENNKQLTAKSFLDELSKGQLKNCDDAKGVFNVLSSNASRIAITDDPEMTDTDSDGEEDMVYSEGNRKDKISKRPYDTDPKWHRDRVQIGARFTWIQAQIADLNHKIKRYGDLYQQVRSTRSRLTLAERVEKPALQSETIVKETLKENLETAATLPVNNMLCIGKNLQNTQKNGLVKHLSKSPSGPDDRCEKGSCSARTLAAIKFPNHRYIKRSLRPEPQLIRSEKCQCPDLSTAFSCLKCRKATVEGHKKSSGNSLAASLDHSYHSQLSFDFDMLLPYHLEETLRKGELDMSIKPLVPASVLKKRDLLKKKLATGRAALCNMVSAEKIAKDKKNSSHSDSLSLKARKLSHLNEDWETDDSEKPSNRAAIPNAALQLHKKAISLRTPGGGSGDSRPSTPIADGPSLTQNHPGMTFAQMKKKSISRPSSEFDINNIVIPYSITSAVRLEKLQYKEILTPGWRMLNEDDEIPEKRIKLELEDDKIEDTSDEALLLRHAPCEVLERNRFSTVYHLPIRRSRSIRKSSECNTPEPHSPVLVEDSGSFSGWPDYSSSTFMTPILPIPNSGKFNKGLPWRLPPLPNEDRVVSWTKREFPLSDTDLTTLKCTDMPLDSLLTVSTDHELVEDRTEINRTFPLDVDVSSSETDFDDKWTVKLVSEDHPLDEDSGTARKGIVLKLAKQ